MGEFELEHRRRRRIDDARRLRDVLRFEFAGPRASSSALPDEHELTLRLACSRNTLRDALNLLRDDHLIERRPGLGTFVLRESLPLVGSQHHGLVHEVDSGKSRVRYELVETLRFPATGLLGERLGAPSSELLRMWTRLTFVDGIPVVLWDTYVREGLGVSLGGVIGDIYDLFDVAGVHVVDTLMRIEAVLADLSVARLLGATPGQPLLRIERELFDADGLCVAVSFGRARGDRFQFSITDHRATECTHVEDRVHGNEERQCSRSVESHAASKKGARP
jgi:GntR family transcriptional regulator